MTAFFELAEGQDLIQVKRVAVLPFETAHIGADGTTASDFFNASMVKTFPGLSLVERSRLEKLLGEQFLQRRSGVVDQDTAAKLESILGVDSLVLGSIVALERDFYGGGKLMMTARLVDTSTARILWADTVIVQIGDSSLRRLWWFFADPPVPSDAMVINRLLEMAADVLVQALARRLDPSLLEASQALAAGRAEAALVAKACAGHPGQ